MFKRILVAFKFTPASSLVLEKAIEIAKELHADLHIFHALDYRLKALESGDPKLREIGIETRNRYEAEIKPLLGDFEHATFGCLPADPALEICRIARRHKSDLIILGSHQVSEKMSLGRLNYVGMTILEKACCPVMLVPN
jgi:nucleotide-binding universal stress UspA family protein